MYVMKTSSAFKTIKLFRNLFVLKTGLNWLAFLHEIILYIYIIYILYIYIYYIYYIIIYIL